ncbi:unnamed protein product [Aphanomyces euteiches]
MSVRLDVEREAEKRVILRREELNKLCVVRDVRSSDSLSKAFQRAYQIYRQCQVYVVERDYDHAYIFLWLLVELYKKKMPLHRDFYHIKYEKDRRRLDAKCRDALGLLDRILDGMLAEERQHLLDETDDDQHILDGPHAVEIVPVLTKADAVSSSLTMRLQALKGEKSPPRVDRTAKEKAFSAIRLKSQGYEPIPVAPAPIPRPPAPTRPAYPSVHGSSPAWLNADIQLRRSSIHDKAMKMREEVRMMSIPSSLVAEFTQLAEPNTLLPPHGVETCGILAGTLKDQELSITTLVIPKQQGSSDTCTMTHEEELFEFCIEHDLLTLGWIHTHPSQTCFLSSVDIHTQCGFQAMLSEAIAIVVAPRDTKKK